MSSPSRPNDPGRQPLPPAAGGGLENLPDPWGVRRAENLLTSLEGVLSARVVTTPLGEVSEVHILAQAGQPAKQLVRNVESALLAQLGLRVDHRKISIAQTADVKPIETLERHAVRERSLQRSVLFESLQMLPGRRPARTLVQVVLTCGGKAEGAEEEAADTMRGRVEAAAKATVAVLAVLDATNRWTELRRPA